MINIFDYIKFKVNTNVLTKMIFLYIKMYKNKLIKKNMISSGLHGIIYDIGDGKILKIG